MQYQYIDDTYLLRVDQGELVHATIHQFCNEHEIHAAWLQGIGAVEFVRCGYYDLGEREYRFTEYEDLVEVVSYTGNVFRRDGQPAIHAHGLFTQTDNIAFGGHIDEMRVGVVLEVKLVSLPTTVEREHDDATGLPLMNLDHKSIR